MFFFFFHGLRRDRQLSSAHKYHYTISILHNIIQLSPEGEVNSGACIPRGEASSYKRLFRERLSEKVHATIPKGIEGGFEFAVFQRNLKEWQKRPWT